MRISREDLKIFIRDLRIREVADEREITDEELVEEIAHFLETNERVIDLNYKRPKTFTDKPIDNGDSEYYV